MLLLFSLHPVQELNTIFYYGRCSSTTVLALEIDVGIPGSMNCVIINGCDYNIVWNLFNDKVYII
jgi:hypothetical protein